MARAIDLRSGHCPGSDLTSLFFFVAPAARGFLISGAGRNPFLIQLGLAAHPDCRSRQMAKFERESHVMKPRAIRVAAQHADMSEPGPDMAAASKEASGAISKAVRL